MTEKGRLMLALAAELEECQGMSDREQVAVPVGFLRDVQQLLTDEDARVLTLAELRALDVGAVVWEEYRQDDGDCYHLAPALISEPQTMTSIYDQETRMTDDLLRHDGDGYQMRYWSSRPSIEATEDEPWTE